MKPKVALISGITGQDGSFLAEHLLNQGYEVHGIVRRVSLEDPRRRLHRLERIQDDVTLHAASLESYASLFGVIRQVMPDECYHLAAQSFVDYSFDDEFSTFNTNVNGTHYLLSSIKELVPACRFYFAASSEMFGNASETPQSERTPFNPRSPYGISKVAGYHLTRNYREAYGLHASSGIAFNHESERRGFEFVTRKITSTVARIKVGIEHELRLGNLEARRDWGYSPDYVRAMHAMLQQPDPQDFVLATGVTHSVGELVELVFSLVSLNADKYVVIDERFYRPTEIHELRGDPSKAEAELGWRAETPLQRIIEKMMRVDLELAQASALSESSSDRLGDSVDSS